MSHGDRTDVLITGAEGQLGRALIHHFDGHDGVTWRAFPKAHLNIDDIGHVTRVAETERPKIIVNCAADTRVARADLAPTTSWTVNTRGVANLARWCARIGALLIHVSTDFVFGRDGNRNYPYQEDDTVGPIGNYAVSKLAGEYEILRQDKETVGGLCYYIIRTAGLFCMPDPRAARNFPRTIADRLRNPDLRPIKVVDDVHTNVTRAEDLAKAIAYFVIQPQIIPFGTYHVVNPGEVTWYDVADRIAENLGYDAGCLESISRAAYRSLTNGDGPLSPSYTCLDIGKYIGVGGPSLPPWSEAIDDWCARYKEL